MRDRIIDHLVQGDRIAWSVVGALWLFATVAVLVHRPGAGGARTAAAAWVLLAVATVASLAGIPLSAALAVPRIRWTTVDDPELVTTTGDGWRRLRGPSVLVGGSDVAVPTIDADGRWVLVGLLSDQPVPGLPEAPPGPLQAGGARLCPAPRWSDPDGPPKPPPPEAEPCRPWPAAWPDPTRPTPLGELGWSRADDPEAGPWLASVLAYDVETSSYLRSAEAPPGAPLDTPVLELLGRVAAEVPRDPAAILFVLRRVAAGRLRAARVVALPLPSGEHAYRLQRADLSLTIGHTAFAWAARPALVLTSLSLPLGVLAFLLAPLFRPEASRREAGAWMEAHLEVLAMVAAGLAIAAPAVVALASLWGSR